MKSFLNTFNIAKTAAAGDDLNLTLDDAFKLFEQEQSDIMKKMLVEMVALGEKEPYGVTGGTLVVNFVLETPGNITKSTRIGRFPLKPELPSTFELHLTLSPSTQVKHRIANLMEKIQGKPNKLVIVIQTSLAEYELETAQAHIGKPSKCLPSYMQMFLYL